LPDFRTFIHETHESSNGPIPDHISMDYGTDGLLLTYRWFSASFVAVAVFCLMWDGFLVFWYTTALTQHAPSMMLVFPVIHVSVGVALTYYALAGFWNKTVITIGTGRLSIRHMPLPWPGNKTLDAADLTQLYSEQQIIRGKNGSRIVYRLNAISRDNRKIRLLSGLNSPDQVRYLERKIEEQLGIRDTPVEGELAR
jgi:hypothetical protein